MSELGEYYQERKEKTQAKRAKNLKDNTEILMMYSAMFDFKVVKNCDTHYSLWHPQRGRLDYWPSTGKACWVHRNKQQYFNIQFLDIYLDKHFKMTP